FQAEEGIRDFHVTGVQTCALAISRKQAAPGGDPAALGDKLGELERELTALYDEWAAYLRSMQAAGPRLEILPVGPLLTEVVAQASAAGGVPVELRLAPGLPDLRGDRLLLREALHNLVANA